MPRVILVFMLIACPLFAKNAPDFNALKKSWGRIDSLTITKSAGDKYTAAVQAGNTRISRDMYMITPEKPELMLWLFHGYKPEGDPYKQAPEIFIKNMDLKELSSWHNALVVIVDSGASLYAYNPDSGLPELQIYCGIYDKLIKQYGILPAVLAGVSSGAEGAVKFAPFVQKLYSLLCISGTYDFNSLAADSSESKDSGEYKIHLKEYGSAGDWKYEEPIRILPVLKCNIILLSEEDLIYRAQAETAARVLGIVSGKGSGTRKIEFIRNIGKGKSHDWYFWGSEEVKKILQREVQAAGEK